jgi:peptidoglycan/xylan/chitin deacetylase (PgdA/CDA1 family)
MRYRVLVYHTVGQYPSGLPAGIDTTPREFARQLDWLLSKGYEVVPLEQIRMDAPGRQVALTFDDGYADCLEHALPALAARRMPATIFVVAGWMGTRQQQGTEKLGILQMDQIREIARMPGMEIGSHGMTHRSLTKLSPSELEEELVRSRETLESATGKPVRYLSYPFGDVNPAVRQAARAAGYQEAFSVWTTDEGPYARLRIPLHHNDGPLRFAFKLSKVYFPLKACVKS